MFTEIEQETLDIDWFFTNGDLIGHVASGGAKLPASVAGSKENIKLLFSFFTKLPGKCGLIVNPDLKHVIDDINDDYLSPFIEMAKKGIYSYDRTNFNNFGGSEYHLVASPAEPIKFGELPGDIQQILAMSKYDGEIVSHLNISLIQ